MTAYSETTRLCPSTPALRAHLDQPDAEVEAHADACATCRTALGELAATAGVAAAAVRQLDAGVEPTPSRADDLLRSVLAAVPPMAGIPATVTPLPQRRSVPRFAAAAGVVVLAAALAVTPAGRGAIAQMLDAFRTERLQVVSFDPRDPGGFEALDALGEVTAAEPQHQFVADAAAAQALSGVSLPSVDPALLPAGLVPGPIGATAPSQVQVVFDRDLAPQLPASVDGATLVVHVPGAVVQVFGPADLVESLASRPPVEAGPGRPMVESSVLDQLPGVAVGAAGELEITVEGASLEDVRAAVLGSGLLPPDLAAQLAAIPDWRSTLPLPIPTGSVAWRDVDVAGDAGYVFGDASGLVAAVVWHEADRVVGVAGALTDAQALAIARGLG